MPSLKDTKRRISSVKNTQKITRAMKLVSSAKYAKANRAIVNASPYLDAFKGAVGRVCSTDLAKDFRHELAKERVEKKALVIVVSTDRGLCGGLNSNLLKSAEEALVEKKKQGVECELALWGKRAKIFGSKRSEKVYHESEKVLEKSLFHFASLQSEKLMNAFKDGSFDGVYLIYPHFKNALTQTPTKLKLLPIRADEEQQNSAIPPDFVTEPTPAELLDYLLERNVVLEMYHALLSAQTSEHAARMTAMDSATQNAEEVIRSLTLTYNRARQAAITKELIEITSGAEAL